MYDHMQFKSFIKSALSLCLAFSLTAVFASSHREAPLIADDPLADNTDVYAFRSPDNPNMITLIAAYVPLQMPQGGPNYYFFGDNIRYEIHVDNNASTPGDDIVYRFTFENVFEDPTTFFSIRLGKVNNRTKYRMERSVDGGATFQTLLTGYVAPPNIGKRSIESAVGLNTTYEALIAQTIRTAPTGEKIYCGPSDDPFFVDLGGIFDLGDAPRQGSSPRDGIACMNTSVICIQVPIANLLKSGASAQPTSAIDNNAAPNSPTPCRLPGRLTLIVLQHSRFILWVLQKQKRESSHLNENVARRELRRLDQIEPATATAANR